jgi:hypothetical protein
MKTKEELEKIAEQAFMQMPQNLKPSELGYVLSCMMKGHSIALKNNGC